ncbi:hypothetical protein [Leptothermofonsia sp. ETS-13]|uniref:hypothetical protein n=1 Tax=Leptothermofonsia sp. ETS-13 TaxID=3035696 RepID=UPI003B9DEF32
MMNQRQRELRRAAARAFMESLDQLHNTLQSPETQPAQPEPDTAQPKGLKATPLLQFDLNTFEQAVADIEAFIENQKQGEGESC